MDEATKFLTVEFTKALIAAKFSSFRPQDVKRYSQQGDYAGEVVFHPNMVYDLTVEEALKYARAFQRVITKKGCEDVETPAQP